MFNLSPFNPGSKIQFLFKPFLIKNTNSSPLIIIGIFSEGITYKNILFYKTIFFNRILLYYM